MAADPSRRQKRRENFPKLKSTHTIDILYSRTISMDICLLFPHKELMTNIQFVSILK